MPIAYRFAAAALIGASGTSVILSMGWPEWELVYLSIISAAPVGASSAGFLFAGLFGKPGRYGYAQCAVGALLTTSLGAALAGFGVGIVFDGTPAGLLLGPILVGKALLQSPLTLLTWIGSMAVANLMMRKVRTQQLMPS